MLRPIAEPDWKIFKQLQDVALDRFCDRVLEEVGGILSQTENSSHERYLAIFKLMERRDRDLAAAFNDVRRSTALDQLVIIQSLDLLTDEEMARFSEETRAVVQLMLR